MFAYRFSAGRLVFVEKRRNSIQVVLITELGVFDSFPIGKRILRRLQAHAGIAGVLGQLGCENLLLAGPDQISVEARRHQPFLIGVPKFYGSLCPNEGLKSLVRGVAMLKYQPRSRKVGRAFETPLRKQFGRRRPSLKIARAHPAPINRGTGEVLAVPLVGLNQFLQFSRSLTLQRRIGRAISRSGDGSCMGATDQRINQHERQQPESGSAL